MRLTKWYMDLMTDDGRATIVSWARLEGLGTALTWSNRLTRTLERVDDASSMLPVGGPENEGDTAVWSHTGFSLRGQWRSMSESCSRRLFESDQGMVQWDCLMPRARARMTIGGETLHGDGYVERLTMTLRPWLLPIRELHWGRFHPAGASGGVVWLEWIGSCPVQVVICDGHDVAGATINGAAIQMNGDRLDLEPVGVLREGAIGSTALCGVPGLGRIAPVAMLRTHEHKRLSRGSLSLRDGRVQRGWAIHETVRFEGTRG